MRMIGLLGLLALVASLPGCGLLWGTNCGDVYWENMERVKSGDYEVRHVAGPADVLAGVDRISLAIDRERDEVTLTYPDGSRETYRVTTPPMP